MTSDTERWKAVKLTKGWLSPAQRFVETSLFGFSDNWLC